MKTLAAYIRVIVIVVLAYFLLEIVAESGEQYAYAKYPILWAVLGFILVFAIAIEISVSSLKSVLYRSLEPEKQQKFDQVVAAQSEKRFGWIKRTYIDLLGSKPLEEEHEIILDHNYDGIKELDNKLPPWWLYGFYGTIIFAVVYLAKYHVFQGETQAQEYVAAIEKADAEVAEYKKNAKGLVDINTVVVLTEEADLKAGKAIFTEKCVACHKADGGGGIGPNLTDEYWILGGGIKDLFKTISEGGRAGKGMIPWKTELKPLEMAQVASYVLTFQGTTPAEPKKAEGELYVDPLKEVEMAPVANDSIPSLEESPNN
jgi:cytochrome c oxidase cbb3-type subunit 3